MSGETLQGRRVPDGHPLFDYEPGDYGRTAAEGGWYCSTPSGDAGNLAAHEVVEHEDGTVTVSPSILVSDQRGELWHGYLERGVWRSV